MSDSDPTPEPNAPKLDVKDAVLAAVKHLELVSLQRVQRIQVEETEYFPSSRQWQITLGWSQADPTFTFVNRSEHRVFTIDADTGHVLSMKLRQAHSPT